MRRQGRPCDDAASGFLLLPPTPSSIEPSSSSLQASTRVGSSRVSFPTRASPFTVREEEGGIRQAVWPFAPVIGHFFPFSDREYRKARRKIRRVLAVVIVVVVHSACTRT